ncbi:lycopene cyclase domain-containing protein [Nocardia speluncae]|uniref:Lycopene cyclase domain-containing protein n=1 Tax=Nocardia speluncae TaxID=419477 RepID=A0A846XBV5_9NOCA|nr:lycopene cyclase domain-containing protein [Nocardia speluncae]NKY32897.1 lycopene cyclase domain-containing protein [Nocardia speluncae]
MDRWQYLIVMGLCLAVTAPLEFFGDGVYRRPARVARSVLPVAGILLVWDAIAIAADVWSYSPRYLTGWLLPGNIPVEELVFFLVIPLCALLTYGAVEAILDRVRRRRVSPNAQQEST